MILFFLIFRSIHFNVNAVRDLLELSARQTLMTVKAIYVRMGQHAKILLLIFRCHCQPGFGGRFCEIDIDDCAELPCHHSSTCIDGVNGFSCSCLPGYTGVLCDINFNDCGSNPCQNGGICADGVNDYLCVCKTGFSGKNCERDIDDCEQAPCKNGGELILWFIPQFEILP